MKEERRSLMDSFVNLLDARAEDRRAIADQRRRLGVLAGCTQLYYEWGGLVFESLNEISESVVMRPTELSHVITDTTLATSVPGQFVYHVEVVGNPKEAALKLRRNLAELRGMTLENFVSMMTVKIIGNNILLVGKK